MANSSTLAERVFKRTALAGSLSRHAQPVPDLPCDRPSIDEWIVGTLRDHGSLSLEQMAAPLRQVNWSELFLAIDRLSRGRQVFIWTSAAGDLVLSLNCHEGKMASARRELAPRSSLS